MSSSPASLAGRRVFLTGASGFVGRHLADRLVADGAKVTALMRSAHGAVALKAAGVQVHNGTLDDAASLDRALAGQDAIVHLAYDVRASAADNLAAFDALYAAAGRAGIDRFVHASSIVVYDDWPDGQIDETSSMDRPGGSPYRDAKIAMEQRLMAGDLPAVILQPTLVWGTGSALWTDTLAEALRAGDVVLPDPEGQAELVHVSDLAAAFSAALALPDPGRERFIISGPAPVRWSDLLRGYATRLGTGGVRHEPLADLQARLGPPPAMDPGTDAAPTAAARVSALARRLIGRDRFEALVRALKRRLRRGDFHPDHHLLELFAATGTCSTRAARDRLGYMPRVDLAAGLEITRL